nr:FAD-dependent oxidoreductase [Roseomonas acroporae]
MDSLPPGTMREVGTPGGPVLLLRRTDGSVHALGARCPHAGAKLADGLLCGDRLLCPWHQGVFRVSDGAMLDPPPLDGLPRYEVRVEDGTIRALLPAGDLPEAAPAARATAGNDPRVFIVLGAGAAGAAAAEALREAGFGGRVLLISAEPYLPYDRTQLSKDHLAGSFPAGKLPLRDADHYRRLGIDTLTREVVDVEAPARRLRFADGGTLDCDALLLATGGVPRRPRIPGATLPGVHLLRGRGDAAALIAAATGARHAAVLGGGFIGLEAAWALRQRGLAVTVVSPEALPLADRLGEPVARLLASLHRRHGTTLHLGARAFRIEPGAGGRAAELVLEDGARVAADLFLIGAGIEPATGLLSGLATEHGAVPVDRFLRTALPDVYAAGDIALFPDARTGERLRVEHWRVAMQQGRVAALNMAGRATAFDAVPFFWTAQCGLRFGYVGHAGKPDRVVVDGDLSPEAVSHGGEFIAYLIVGDTVRAAVACGRERDMAALHELFRLGRPPRCDAPDAVPAPPLPLLREAGC